VSAARWVIKHAAPNIIEMIDVGEISLNAAFLAIRHVSKDEQEDWTAQDMRKRSSRHRDKEVSFKRRQRKAAISRITLLLYGLSTDVLHGLEPLLRALRDKSTNPTEDWEASLYPCIGPNGIGTRMALHEFARMYTIPNDFLWEWTEKELSLDEARLVWEYRLAEHDKELERKFTPEQRRKVMALTNTVLKAQGRLS
jgi:hypothetical protein